ncbi:hypothetical protein GJAV_G00051400 [Gymnothorax javanicus]|nr:hypothetical protein GJAV_G00051400 [Gymnothorax javanicus]
MSRCRDLNSNPDHFTILNTNELRDLLQDEGTMDQIIRLSQKFQGLQVDREALLTSNHGLAEQNLSRRPRLLNCKLLLAEKYQELEKLATVCREKQSRLDACMQRHGPQTAEYLLQEEMALAEGKSEELLEKFITGDMSLEEFLDSFQTSRKVYHIRRTQTEKLKEMCRPWRKLGNLNEAKNETSDQPKPLPDNTAVQATPRVFQLRYGLTPAIIIPRVPLTSIPAPHLATCLPSLDKQLNHTQASGPTAPCPGPGQPVSLRVIGQLSGWSARPVRLQQLCRQPNHQQQRDPPLR